MQFFKYIISGIFNTFIGYFSYLFLILKKNAEPEFANLIAYAVALISAFILNKYFVFSDANLKGLLLLKFLAAFFFAFLINQFVLYISYRVFNISAELAQIIAMISYTISFYYFNKNFVFKTH